MQVCTALSTSVARRESVPVSAPMGLCVCAQLRARARTSESERRNWLAASCELAKVGPTTERSIHNEKRRRHDGGRDESDGSNDKQD